jgi:membrane fusion protein (multidrug efflux system)
MATSRRWFPAVLACLAAASRLSAAPPEAKPDRSEARAYASHLMVDQDVVLCARITGVVDQVLVDRGSVVAKGQALAQLDAREFDASVNEAREEMELARVEYERAEKLAANNVLSRQDLDQKRAQHAVAIARWEKAKTQRDYAVIRAPFAGVVTEKYVRVGQKVIEDKADPLFKVTAMEPLLARIYVVEKEVLTIHRGAGVDVVPVNFPEAKTTGSVDFISPTVDAGSGLFQVVIRVRRDPAQPVLRPGLAVEIRFPEQKR